MGFKTKKIYDKYNLNANHGELNDWKNLPIDIGCHSNDHKKIIIFMSHIQNIKIILVILIILLVLTESTNHQIVFSQ